MRFIGVLLCTALLCSGCRHKPAAPAVVPSSKSNTAELPVVTQTPDEIRATMRGMDPYSQEFEDAQFKLVIKLDELRKQHGVEGFEQVPLVKRSQTVAVVEPKTRTLAWQALNCLNPDCPARGPGGGPFLFVSPVKGFSVGPNGELVIESVEPEMKSPNCPVCGSSNYVRVYEMPEAIARHRELMKELMKTREAALAQRRAGRPHEEESNRSVAIQDEMHSLPKLYLVPQDTKLHEVGAFLAPLKTK
ncbi:MAG: hypothetical protein K8T25_03225 [Planctomycetia bacterium]|nr:hypothetical protein [Planctomycetia bacterium]